MITDECSSNAMSLSYDREAHQPGGPSANSTAGRIAERYAYTTYGEFVVLKGDSGSCYCGCMGNAVCYIGADGLGACDGGCSDGSNPGDHDCKRDWRRALWTIFNNFGGCGGSPRVRAASLLSQHNCRDLLP